MLNFIHGSFAFLSSYANVFKLRLQAIEKEKYWHSAFLQRAYNQAKETILPFSAFLNSTTRQSSCRYKN